MKLFLSFFLFLVVFAFPSLRIFAQTDTIFVELPDSVREKEHSPTKATIMSACLPGLGQFYNKKYWKIPIIYAGIGVLGYVIYFNATEYNKYKGAYFESTNGITTGQYSDLVNSLTADQILASREFYNRNLEITFLLTAVWYGLNILDATVDAHLYTFNITDNLTMKVEPVLLPSTGFGFKPVGGMKLCLHF